METRSSTPRSQSPPYSLTLDGGLGGAATLAVPYPNQQLGWGDTHWVNFATGASSNLSYPLMPENFTTPLVQSYNLSIQYEFIPRWASGLEVVRAAGAALTPLGNHDLIRNGDRHEELPRGRAI